MRSLSETNIFEPVDKLMGVKKTLTDPSLIKNYGIPIGLYDYIVQSFKGYKYPLAKYVYRYAMDRKIAPIMIAESTDSQIKSPHNFPMSIPCFQIGNVAYADISPQASYIRDNVTKEPNHLKIAERELYAYLQSALVLKTFNTNAARLEGNAKFLKMLAELYSIFLSKAIDKNYPVSSERAHYSALQYLCGLFFLEYVVKLPEDKAKTIAGSLRLVDTSTVSEVLGNLEYLPAVDTLDSFFQLMAEKFPYLRSDAFKYRNIVFVYTKMYGQNAVFAIENMFAFVNMVLMANMRIGVYNDAIIDNVAGRYVDDLEKMLAELLSSIHEQ